MIKELDLTPYPRKLWIVRNESIENLKSKFDLDELQCDMIDSESYCGLALSTSKNKNAGYMVILYDEATLSTCLHEAIHVVMDLYSDLEMNISNDMDQEPFAYYVEYVFNLLSNERNN